MTDEEREACIKKLTDLHIFYNKRVLEEFKCNRVKWQRIGRNIKKRTDEALFLLETFFNDLKIDIQAYDEFCNGPFLTPEIVANYKTMFEFKELPERETLVRLETTIRKRVSHFASKYAKELGHVSKTPKKADPNHPLQSEGEPVQNPN